MYEHSSRSRSDCGNSASIISWLDEQPIEPADYETENAEDYERSTKGKRPRPKYDAVQQPRRPREKRARLLEITANEMTDPGKAPAPLRRSARKAQHQAPLGEKETSERTAGQPSTPGSQRPSHGIPFDEDPTPKAPVVSLGSHLDKAPPVFIPWDRHSDLSSNTTKSSQPRGTSPTKHLTDFQLSDVRVELKDFGTPGYALPVEAKTLFEHMRRISKGSGVIPRAFEQRMYELNEVDFTEDTNFETANNKPGEYNALTAHEYDIFWHNLLKVREAARECQNEAVSEPEWNCEVHLRLLRLALKANRVTSNVWYRNVTLASIGDTSLLPTISGSGTKIPAKMQGKMVDFVIMIEPDETLNTDIIRFLKQAYPIKSRRTINHTSTDSLRFKPIAVSIETKRAAINEDTAHLQLSVWVLAHFAKLQQVISLSSDHPSCSFDLPILPLIVVQGHAWKLLIAYSPNTQTLASTTPPTVIILREIALGSTATTLGTFTIIASLRRLREWVKTEFCSWWVSCLQGGGSDRKVQE